jgi:hypothetical protein
MEIKENKTRISLWLKGKRFYKIEPNKLIFTNGYSKHNRNLWKTSRFNKIDNCLELLQSCLLERTMNISLEEQQYIKKLYIKLFV